MGSFLIVTLGRIVRTFLLSLAHGRVVWAFLAMALSLVMRALLVMALGLVV